MKRLIFLGIMKALKRYPRNLKYGPPETPRSPRQYGTERFTGSPLAPQNNTEYYVQIYYNLHQ